MKLLERIYSTGEYIKYLDGIRCVSIIAVVYHHFVRYYVVKDKMPETQSYHLAGIDIFHFFPAAIYMFFTITGFIIGLMFVRSYLEKGKGVDLKKYFFRRFTRMEPPYLVLLTLFFMMSLFMGDKGGFTDLIFHYLASFFYVHNIVYDPMLPLINGVLWTFELQIQFYFIAPLIAMLFKFPPIVRRLCLLFLILFLGQIAHAIFHFEFRNIFQYSHYFILGFLIADFYYNYKGKIKPSHIFDVVSIVFVYFLFQGVENSYLRMIVFAGIIFFLNFSIYVKRVFEWKWIVIIGGMSYSIFMMHQRIQFAFLNGFYFDKVLFNNFYIDFFLKFLASSLVVFLCSVVFFIFVERPTMKREWWKYRNLKKLFFE